MRIDGPVTILASSGSAALTVTQPGAGSASVIDASGVVIANYTADMGGSNVLQAKDKSIGVFNYGNVSYVNGLFNSYKSRSTTPGVFTAVQSGDELGYIFFRGDDGTAFRTAAFIGAIVDGTPGTNDMPGRLVFSTTADGASSPTEAMRIDSKQNVGIGTAPVAGQTLRLGKSMTGGSGYCYGFNNVAQISSDTTAEAVSFQSFISTQAAAFTLANLRHFKAYQATVGASSVITTQAGFFSDPTLIGATNNYGFYSDIASAANRYNFYAAGSAPNYFAGSVGIGTTALTGYNLRIGANSTGATTCVGLLKGGTVQSDVTGAYYGFKSELYTAAAAFTLTSASHFYADQKTIGASSAVTDQRGFHVPAIFTGATNNYGFYSNIASGSNRYNFYAAGSAPNYFAGTVTAAGGISGGTF